MVSTRLCIVATLASVLFSGLANAEPQSFSVSSVKVEKQGQWRDDPNGQQTAKQCAQFKMSDREALRWFQRSKEVSQRIWLEELDWTQCSVSGELITGDKRRYRWRLDQSGRGEIEISPTVSVYLSGKEIPFKQSRLPLK